MKLIYRLLASVLVLFTAAACYNQEIEGPQNPDQPQMSELRITASIVKTRVSYSDAVETDDLILSWQKGDILFGYIGQIKSNTVTLTVDEVDEGGVASLKAEGENLTKLLATTDGAFVDLIYTGSAPNSEALASETYTVDMTTQTPNGKIPACMHARGIVKESNGSKSLNFNFQNDCAIIEILGVTGPRNDENFSGGQLSSISITNLPLAGYYSYSVANGFSFAGTNEVHTITLDDELGSGWTIGSDGRISNTDSGKRILIAVAPYSSPYKDGITVSAVSGESKFDYTYKGKTFEQDICYVIHDKDVVARVGNEYFTTVTDAFNKAKEVYNPQGNTSTPTVVLLRNCGLAGVNIDGTSNIYGLTPISIDSYDVTFDLNGHTLTLAKNEHFDVSSGKKFIIKDSSDPSTGLIQSNYTDDGGYHIIYNNGIVTIDGGQLRHNQDWCVVRNYSGASLTVNGSSVLYSDGYNAICNTGGDIVINDGVISADYDTIDNEDGGNVFVNGGLIYSEDYNAIYNLNASLTINDGTIYSVNSAAIYFGHNVSDATTRFLTIVEQGKGNKCPMIYNNVDVTDVDSRIAAIKVVDESNGTNFDIRNGQVYSTYGAVDLQGNVSGKIFGGQFEGNAYCALAMGNGVDMTISGGKFIKVEEATDQGSAVRVYDTISSGKTCLTICWHGDEFEDDKEPLFYAINNKNVSLDTHFGSNNTPTINIQGGYFYSTATDYFYVETNAASGHNILQEETFGDFFSNKYEMTIMRYQYNLYNGSTSGFNRASYNGKKAKLLDETTKKSIGVTLHVINETTFKLENGLSNTLYFCYHITDPDDSKNSGTQSYHFRGFSW